MYREPTFVLMLLSACGVLKLMALGLLGAVNTIYSCLPIRHGLFWPCHSQLAISVLSPTSPPSIIYFPHFSNMLWHTERFRVMHGLLDAFDYELYEFRSRVVKESSWNFSDISQRGPSQRVSLSCKSPTHVGWALYVQPFLIFFTPLTFLLSWY